MRQEALVRLVSDHCRIVVDTNAFKWGLTPFGFENMWLKNSYFKERFKEWWKESTCEVGKALSL